MTVAERLAHRVTRTVDNRLGRRGFIARSAVVGSALTTAPVHYVLRPVTAYAAVCQCAGQSCGCGSQCCDGWTEFCCSMTGENRCPPGATVAGWWKVGASNFCGGTDRYYFDCNAGCGSCGCGSAGVCSGGCTGTRCGCANGDCGLRKTGCTLFRYGQCNNDTACVGPIVCRVISCIPPWEVDSTCTRRTLTNDATRFHDATCLHDPVGSVDHVVRSGDSLRVAGWALHPDVRTPATVRLDHPTRPTVQTTADQPRPDVAAHYPGHGPDHGFDVVVPADDGWCVTVTRAPDVEIPLGCIGSGEPVTGTGYWVTDDDGTLYPFGTAEDALGSVPNVPVASGATVVDLTVNADGTALLALDSAGGVHAFGAARHLGDARTVALRPGERWTAIVTPPDGDGYWLFTDRGRGAAHGVPSIGDIADLDLTAPVVGATGTPTGAGVWLLGGDGGVFALGDAPFVGSVPETIPIDDLVRPLTAIMGNPRGTGYWLVAEDGGVFAFQAPFRGALPEVIDADDLEGPIVGGVPYGNGYLLVADDGGVFNFSDQPFSGSLGGEPLRRPVTALTAFTA